MHCEMRDLSLLCWSIFKIVFPRTYYFSGTIDSFQDVESLGNFVVGYFLTKIFHPNIATNGEICVNTLKKDWNPSLGLRHVLIVSSLAVVLVLMWRPVTS